MNQAQGQSAKHNQDKYHFVFYGDNRLTFNSTVPPPLLVPIAELPENSIQSNSSCIRTSL